MEPEISLIIPVKDEKENLPMLIGRLMKVMKAMGKHFECIFIDDGSTDGSAEVILSFKKDHPEIQLIQLRRNFGQTAALAAGFDHAHGRIVVTMDADMQNDPDDIPRLIEKLEEGYDLVSGWRKKRHDALLRTFSSNAANWIISKVTGIHLHDSGCTLKAYRREVVKSLRLYGEMHRFIPALASWAGVSIVEIPVAHHPRLRGESKYGFARIPRVVLDLITVKFFLSYQSRPSQVFGNMGLLSCVGGMFFFAAVLVMKIVERRTLTGNPLFYLFIFMETTGVQLVLIGLLAEVNIRTYYESQQKSTYVIKSIS